MSLLRKSLILLLMCVAFAASAQITQHSFSLNEAVVFALENNKMLKTSGKDIEVANKQRWQAISAGLPQISASLDYTTMFNYKLEIMGMPISMKDQSNIAGNLQQLIFSGQYIQGILLSNLSKQISEQAYAMTELDIKENVANAYYLTLITEESKSIVELNLKDLEIVLEHTQSMYEVGMAEITDVDQLRVTVSQLKNALSTLKNTISLNYNLLRFHLGVDAGDEIVLTDNLDYFLGQQLYTLLMDESFDVLNNIQYQIMETQEKLSQKNVGMQKWAFAPSIVGVYSYTEKFLKPELDMSPNQMLNFTMSIPVLSSWDRMSKVGQAKIELEKTQLNKELLEDQLYLQENQLRSDLQNAIDNYLLQKENVEVAQRVFQNYKNKYEYGILSSLELTQANSNYLTAQTNYLESAMALLQAQLKLQKLFNTL
ncbi:MAG: TolC family protein [Bacteroidales bacterium]|nr:TolC family protein [Bacteroidales bacterium]